MNKLTAIFLFMLIQSGFLLACNQPVQKDAVSVAYYADDTAKKFNTIIVDVRTVEEWEQDGHAGCSVNYPLDILESKIDSLKQYREVVVVCRSGNRAGYAKDILERAGIRHVENKGAWQNIHCNN